MATRSARTTRAQRDRIAMLAVELQIAFDDLPGRFWTTRDINKSFETVLAHLTRWADWEHDNE